ncbi:uncharacterized protein LOC113293992 [Papaver somniferum]|uniref:uncharacterized protein LOC113293992 n=1 Tax=Papaver somniferum TaxID=3469 RepID=UPI000E6FE78B|nr:uncharacterized protein LOC113293992 [Papaver somniferum]
MRIARDQLEKNLSEDNDTWDIVKAVFDKRWKNNFNHPLHCAVYYLNPSIFYKIPAQVMDNDTKYIEIKRELHAAMERLITNEDELELATTELRRYSDAYDDWWIIYGGIDVPNLQKFAIRILSLTSSASPCERNWSTFQNLHSKKRNRIKQQKSNDSVFIQYNKKLQRRYKEISEYNDDEKARDPIFLDDHDENDEWLDPQNLEDLVVEGDNVTIDDLQDILGEESRPVGSIDTDYRLLDGANGVTEDDDIYSGAYDFE